jgi:CheY-like chemotaxis protein
MRLCQGPETESSKQPESHCSLALKVLTVGDGALVMADQAMPHMTGAQIADFIRHRYPQQPVILATGYAEKLRGLLAAFPG